MFMLTQYKIKKCKNPFEISLYKFPYAVVKGEALSIEAYNKLDQRHIGDIDILLPRNKLSSIENILINADFTTTAKTRSDRIIMLSNSHQVAPWIKLFPPIGNIEIDINFDLFWGEYTGKRIDVDVFLSDTLEMDIYGVKVKTLPPLKAMIQLVLHHYKDLNSIFLIATRQTIKQNMFKDVYYLLKNNLDTITLDKLYATSSEYGIIPYVFYVLYYTGQVFDDEILKLYIEAFRTSEGEALLNCYGLCAKEQKEWKYDFKTRLESDNLYELIKDDLTEKDREKIALNKRVFLGVSE